MGKISPASATDMPLMPKRTLNGEVTVALLAGSSSMTAWAGWFMEAQPVVPTTVPNAMHRPTKDRDAREKLNFIQILSKSDKRKTAINGCVTCIRLQTPGRASTEKGRKRGREAALRATIYAPGA